VESSSEKADSSKRRSLQRHEFPEYPARLRYGLAQGPNGGRLQRLIVLASAADPARGKPRPPLLDLKLFPIALRRGAHPSGDDLSNLLVVLIVGQDRLAFLLSNEAEVEEGQEESGIDDGAHAADLGRLDKIRAQERTEMRAR
jgi:hypothetical protein